MNFKNLFISLEDTQISRAAHLSAFAHRNQFRNDGTTPYLAHILQVVLGLDNPDRETLMVAWLHDTVEDTDLTLDELSHDYKFSQSVVDAVDTITKRAHEKYDDFIVRVTQNRIALAVKEVGIRHNLSDSPSARQVKKYSSALQIIENFHEGIADGPGN
jgi:(p)ppGpp synthase/HD superfamily hydrolase